MQLRGLSPFIMEARGLDLVRRYLRSLHDSAINLREPYEEIGQYLVSETQMRFQRGVTPEDNVWPASERVKREGGQTLVNHARLVQSITYQTTDTSLEVGSNVVYAAIHQLGGRTGRGHAAVIPARPYLGLSRWDESEMLDILQRYLIPG